MSVDWKTKIGKKIWTLRDGVGTLLAIDGGMIWTKSESGKYAFFHKSSVSFLIPEWEPKIGEWVTIKSEPTFTCAYKWQGSGGACARGYRPLTDDEKIEICGGVDEVLRLASNLGSDYLGLPREGQTDDD